MPLLVYLTKIYKTQMILKFLKTTIMDSTVSFIIVVSKAIFKLTIWSPLDGSINSCLVGEVSEAALRLGLPFNLRWELSDGSKKLCEHKRPPGLKIHRQSSCLSTIFNENHTNCSFNVLGFLLFPSSIHQKCRLVVLSVGAHIDGHEKPHSEAGARL